MILIKYKWHCNNWGRNFPPSSHCIEPCHWFGLFYIKVVTIRNQKSEVNKAVVSIETFISKLFPSLFKKIVEVATYSMIVGSLFT